MDSCLGSLFLILKVFKSCKSLQFANYQAAGCQWGPGRRQGRSLKICYAQSYFLMLIRIPHCRHPRFLDCMGRSFKITLVKILFFNLVPKLTGKLSGVISSNGRSKPYKPEKIRICSFAHSACKKLMLCNLTSMLATCKDQRLMMLAEEVQ